MEVLLFTGAAVLGLLAFFEPCTIATHTLYSARTYQNRANRTLPGNLLQVWLSRSALLSIVLAGGVRLTAPLSLSSATQAGVLGILALLYLISRLVYIPIPHAAFYLLIPGGRKLPYGIQLGLSLPACTLPLILIVMAIAAQVDSLLFTVIAACLFATLFSLPMAFSMYYGVHAETQAFLKRAARASPYVTAVILLSWAFYLVFPQTGLGIPVLEHTLSQAGWPALGLAFFSGFVFSFNPVSFASIPVMLAYVTKSHEKYHALLMGMAFVAGMLSTHAVLGIAAALGGEWAQSIMGRHWGLLLGPLLLLMGLIWLGWLPWRLPWFGVKGRKVTGFTGAFLLAVPFSVAVCPFCTPALMVALTASAAIASPLFGAAMLLAFATGRSIPMLLGAWSMEYLESLRIFNRYQKYFEAVAGTVLIATGLYLLNAWFMVV